MIQFNSSPSDSLTAKPTIDQELCGVQGVCRTPHALRPSHEPARPSSVTALSRNPLFMSLQQHLRFAGIGWIGGIAFVAFLAFVVMPNTFGSNSTLSSAADQLIFGLAVLISTPAALLGGIVGGRTMREGGVRSQVIMAAILGAVFTIPFGCIGLWYLGW